MHGNGKRWFGGACSALAAAGVAFGQASAPNPKAFPVTPAGDIDEGEGHHAPACSIMLPEGGERGLTVTSLWPGGVMPYVFSDNTTQAMRDAALAAMDEIEAVSNVRFIPRTTEFDYIFIQDSDVNSSFVGRRGGQQTVNVTSWSWRFIIVHEYLHALGVWHEHQRPDRDQFVIINWENIEAGAEHNFTIRNGDMQGPYDFDSVMHYNQCSFSMCSCSSSCRTITMQPGFEELQATIGQRSRLSDGDIAMLNTLYDGGAVENLTSGEFFSTLSDAVDAATPGDTLLSEPSQFGRRPDYDLGGKAITVLSSEDVVTPSGSIFVLADGGALGASAGFDLRLLGLLDVPAGATASAFGDVLELEPSGRVRAQAGAVVGLTGVEDMPLGGVLELADSAEAMLVAPSITLEAGGLIDAGPGAIVSTQDPSPILVGGEVRLGAGGALRSAGAVTVSPGGAIRAAGVSAGVDAPSLTLDGLLQIQAASQATLQIGSIVGDGQIIAREDAALTLEVGDLTLDGSASVLGFSGSVIDLPGASAQIVDAGRMLSLQDARLQSAAALTLGDPDAPLLFSEQTVTTQQAAPQAVAVGDLNADGLADVAIVSLADNRVGWSRHNPEAPSLFSGSTFVDFSAGGPLDVAVGDVNGDGDTDIVVASTFGNAVFRYESTGADSPSFVRSTIASGISGASSVAVVDLDQDGATDVISTGRITGAVTWHRNLGGVNPQFESIMLDDALDGAFDAAAADLDDDGDLDVVAAGRTGGEVVWYEAQSAHSAFVRHTILAGGGGATAIALDDVTGDGSIDIVVAERDAGRVTLLRSDGAATPSFTVQTIAAVSTPTTVDLFDLDGDDALDVVAGSLQNDGVTAHISDGAPIPAFTPIVVRPALNGVTRVVVADIDADADADVVMSVSNTSSVVWQQQRQRSTLLRGVASLAAPMIEHHRALELDGGTVETPLLRIGRSGALIGVGQVTGDLELIDGGRARALTDLAVGGSLRVGPSGGLEPGAGVLRVAGDLTFGHPRSGEVDLAGTTLVVGGAAPSVVEPMAPDLGPAGAPVLATLRVPAGATVDLQDPDAGAREAIYASELVVEAGATLRTNGLRIYYQSFILDGVVEGAEHVARIQLCPGDMTGDGAVDGADLGQLLGLWGTTAAGADLNADGVVDGADLGVLLGGWGSCG